MPSGSERVAQMDPSDFIYQLKKFADSKNYNLDEVFIRGLSVVSFYEGV